MLQNPSSRRERLPTNLGEVNEDRHPYVLPGGTPEREGLGLGLGNPPLGNMSHMLYGLVLRAIYYDGKRRGKEGEGRDRRMGTRGYRQKPLLVQPKYRIGEKQSEQSASGGRTTGPLAKRNSY